MPKRIFAIMLVTAVVILGGLGYLMTADIPAPSQEVSKTLSNDRFPS